MRHEPNLRIENYRLQNGPLGPSEPGKNWGAFLVGNLSVISSGLAGAENPDAKGWEHVSVSLGNRCPTWEEMSKIKELFWRDDETVIQFHPRKEAYINCHPFCLHLWKRSETEWLLPPKELIG